MTLRRLAAILALPLILGLALLLYGYRAARADPVVRRAAVTLPGWPHGAPPVTVALLSDIHIGSMTMDADRLARIVAQVNALRPDLVVIAGDFVNGHAPGSADRLAPALTMPLSGLRAPLGVVAVPGNHDHWTSIAAVDHALARAGVVVLRNGAIVRGPLVVGGLDDQPTRHARVGRTLAAMAKLAGAGVLVAHSPDPGGALPPDVRLVMAGHTHCGQIVLPIVGAPRHVADPRYLCGIVRDPGRITIVSAGLGTSVLPFRIGAPPDLWLVRLSG